MAIDRRDVPAVDLRAQVNRFAGLAADQMHFRFYPPAGLEHVPQLVVLGRRAVAEPLVELEVGQVDLQVQRRVRRVAQPDRSVGAQARQSVGPLGVLDRKDTVLHADDGRQFVDRERQLGALPYPFA